MHRTAPYNKALSSTKCHECWNSETLLKCVKVPEFCVVKNDSLLISSSGWLNIAFFLGTCVQDSLSATSRVSPSSSPGHLLRSARHSHLLFLPASQPLSLSLRSVSFSRCLSFFPTRLGALLFLHLSSIPPISSSLQTPSIKDQWKRFWSMTLQFENWLFCFISLLILSIYSLRDPIYSS